MLRYIGYFIFTLIFISCSKNDDSKVLEEDPPIDVISKIGVKYFGPEVNSYDEGNGIFDVSDGYVSIEQLNLDYSNSQSEGFANISFRKLDSNLETINEMIFETETHDYLRSVIQANDSFVILENQINSDQSIKETYVKILSSNGEILKSKLMVAIQGSDAVLFNFGNLYFENNVIYASYRLSAGPNISVLTALDMELNVLWETTFNNTVHGGKIYAENNENVYLVTRIPNSDGLYSIPVLNVLDSSNGNLISSFEYPNSEHYAFTTFDIVSKGEFLYVGGDVIQENEAGSIGAMIKISKENGQQKSIEYWSDYGAIIDIEVGGDNLFINLWDSKFITTSIIEVDNDFDELWNYSVSGNARKIHRKDNGDIIFTGGASKPGSPDRTLDIFIGLLNQNGEIK